MKVIEMESRIEITRGLREREKGSCCIKCVAFQICKMKNLEICSTAIGIYPITTVLHT